ncbi:MAG: hypothetical protein SPJ13_06210 [Bacteroidales bacterium]|nr:hypothetical protein [Bacteroidales bacterium]
MEEMDRYYMDHPTAGVLTMVNMLALNGIVVNQKQVRRPIRLMGINAIYPKKCLSKGDRPQYFQPPPLTGCGSGKAEPGVERRHLLYTDEGRIHVPLCRD